MQIDDWKVKYLTAVADSRNLDIGAAILEDLDRTLNPEKYRRFNQQKLTASLYSLVHEIGAPVCRYNAQQWAQLQEAINRIFQHLE